MIDLSHRAWHPSFGVPLWGASTGYMPSLAWFSKRWYRNEVVTPDGRMVALPHRKARLWPDGHRRLVRRWGRS